MICFLYFGFFSKVGILYSSFVYGFLYFFYTVVFYMVGSLYGGVEY